MSEEPALCTSLPAASTDSIDLTQLELIDPGSVDWPRVQRTAFLVHQHLRYEYPGPIAHLHQRLMIMPPAQHGDQRLVMSRLDISPVPARRTESRDVFGNLVVDLQIPVVEEAVEFEAWIVVERLTARGPLRLPPEALADRLLLRSTALTAPDEALHAAAATLAASGTTGRALVEHIGAWTHDAIRYEAGVTDVETTAAEALALGRGVCQDHAHVMIALCRQCGLPARYVSGHLLGEGGTHAWVEVLVPDPEQSGAAIACAYDPANGCPVGLRYVTIAVGRDYADVAPTSGTFIAAYAGALHARKRVDVTAAEYEPAALTPA